MLVDTMGLDFSWMSTRSRHRSCRVCWGCAPHTVNSATVTTALWRNSCKKKSTATVQHSFQPSHYGLVHKKASTLVALQLQTGKRKELTCDDLTMPYYNPTTIQNREVPTSVWRGSGNAFIVFVHCAASEGPKKDQERSEKKQPSVPHTVSARMAQYMACETSACTRQQAQYCFLLT